MQCSAAKPFVAIHILKAKAVVPRANCIALVAAVKHGTCAEPVLGNRPSFFKTVLELDDKYDLDVSWCFWPGLPA